MKIRVDYTGHLFRVQIKLVLDSVSFCACGCRKGIFPYLASFFGLPPSKDFLGNEVSFQVLSPKNVVLCLFKAGIQTHFLCSINVNHNVKSLNLSENGQKLSSSSSRTTVYVKKYLLS